MTPSQANARTREVIRRQYKALATEESYVHWVRRSIMALQAMPVGLSSEQFNLQPGALTIRGVKGGKDRVVALPASLKAELQQPLARARTAWQRDQQHRIPVALPFPTQDLVKNKLCLSNTIPYHQGQQL